MELNIFVSTFYVKSQVFSIYRKKTIVRSILDKLLTAAINYHTVNKILLLVFYKLIANILN